MTGKGGIGKTSVAAATGLRCAELGYKTLVLSTDPAHSLADSFDLELGHDPRPVRPNLWGAELDALMELEGNWGAVKRYITQVLQARGLEGTIVEPIFRPIAGFSLPDKEVMNAPYEFYQQIEALEKVLTDPTQTSVRLVMNPEKMVIKGSLRAHAYLSLYNVGTDLVIANRFIPESVTDPFFQQWKTQQQQYRQEIHNNFMPLPDLGFRW